MVRKQGVEVDSIGKEECYKNNNPQIQIEQLSDPPHFLLIFSLSHR